MIDGHQPVLLQEHEDFVERTLYPAPTNMAVDNFSSPGPSSKELFRFRGRVPVVESARLQLHLCLPLRPRRWSWQQCPDLSQVFVDKFEVLTIFESK